MESRDHTEPEGLLRSARLWGAIGFVLCTAWLSVGVAFFGMITSGGEAGMELEIGPFLRVEGTSAIVFVRGVIAAGLLMLVLFVARRRVGEILAIAWSVFWALMLSTALYSSSSNAERVVILVIVLLFCWSGFYAWKRLGNRRARLTPDPSTSD